MVRGIEIDPTIEAVVSSVAETGFAIVPEFFDSATVDLLISESHERLENGDFKQAAVGRGSGKQIQTEIRTDDVHWIDPDALTVAQSLYWTRMELLREALNRSLFLGLVELEAHLARFAPGGFYKPHLDRHQSSNARILSSIVYLDDGWSESDGGQLRIFTDLEAGIEGPFVDVFPKPGQLAVFVSADFWHEVRVATRHRHSITGWFRGRESDAPNF